LIIRRGTQTTLVDFPDVYLGFSIPGFCGFPPYRESGGVICLIEFNILSTPDSAIARGGFDRTPCGQISKIASKSAYLSGQQAIHDFEVREALNICIWWKRGAAASQH
jgi:hypothetical protein